MVNYTEIKDWLDGMTFSSNFDQFKRELNQGLLHSDATIFILNSSMKPNIEIIFEDSFPISLSGMTMKTDDENVKYIEVTATFEYKIFTVIKS